MIGQHTGGTNTVHISDDDVVNVTTGDTLVEIAIDDSDVIPDVEAARLGNGL